MAANSGTFNATSTSALVTGTFTQVAAGNAHSLALRADGTLLTWGSNQAGQLGVGTTNTTPNPTPTQEATAATIWTTLAPGPSANFSLARTISGYAFASTGFNSAGQLGDGTTTDASRFDRVSPLKSLQPLPVELAAFEAQRTGPAAVLLTWSTASELHNAGFGIESSADGVAFRRLGFVAGAGLSASAHAYSFDADAVAATYYRLAQTDADGTVSYSPVRFVPGGAATSQLVLVPNPARAQVQALGLPACRRAALGL